MGALVLMVVGWYGGSISKDFIAFTKTRIIAKLEASFVSKHVDNGEKALTDWFQGLSYYYLFAVAVNLAV